MFLFKLLVVVLGACILGAVLTDVVDTIEDNANKPKYKREVIKLNKKKSKRK